MIDILELARAEGNVVAIEAADLQVVFSGDTSDADAAFARMDKAVGNTAKTTAEKLRGTGLFLTGLGAAGGAVFGAMIGKASSFEKQMDAVAAVTGSTGQEFDDLTAKALSVGAATQFSAQEAAMASEELAKLGVSAQSIMGGALDATTSLAAAIGSDLPSAATSIAAALNMFNLSASESANVADTMTAAINASATDLVDFNAGMRNLGPSAASVGLTFEDTAAAIAYFTNFGLKGADVGVSLARALDNVAKPEASAQLKALGVNVFDTTGNFVGFADVADQLRVTMGGMSDEVRLAALQTIFGAEAADVMNIAIREGGDGLREMTETVQANGQAQEQAKKRMDNFAGSMEALRGSVETLFIIIGSKFLPILRKVVDAIGGVVNIFIEMPGPVQTVIAILGTLGTTLALTAGGFILFGGKIKAARKQLELFVPAIRKAIASMAGITLPVLAIIAVIAALYLAYKYNFLGFRDGVNHAIDSMKEKIEFLKGAFSNLVDFFRLGFNASQTVQEVGKINQSIVQFQNLLGKVIGEDNAKKIGMSLRTLQAPLRHLANDFGQSKRALQNFWNIISGKNVGGAELERFRKRLTNLFGGKTADSIVKSSLKLRKSFEELGNGLRKLFGLKEGGNFFAALAAGIIEWMGKAMEFLRIYVLPVIGFVLAQILSRFQIFIQLLADIVNGDWKGAMQDMADLALWGPRLIIDAFNQMFDFLERRFPGLTGPIETFRGAIGVVWDWISGTALPAITAFGEAVYTAIVWVAGAAFTWIHDTGWPMLTAIWDWFSATALPDIQTLGDAIYTALVWVGGAAFTWLRDTGLPAIKEVWTWMTDTAVPAVQGFADDVSISIGEITDIIGGIWDLVSPKLQPLADFFGDSSTLLAGIQGVASGIAEPVGTIIAYLGGIWDSPKQGLQDLMSWFLTIGTVITDARDTVGPIIVSIGGYLLAIFGAASTVWTALTSVSGWFDGLAGVVGAAKDAVMPILTEIGDAIQKLDPRNWGVFGGGDNKESKDTADNRPTQGPAEPTGGTLPPPTFDNVELQGALDDYSGRVHTAFAALSLDARTQMDTLMVELVLSIARGASSMATAADGIVTGVTTKFHILEANVLAIIANFVGRGIALLYSMVGPASGAGASVGNAFGSGMFLAMDAWVGSIASKAAEIVNTAEAAARSAADSKSPSKKWMDLTNDMMLGGIIGFNRAAPSLAKAAADAIAGANGSARLSMVQVLSTSSRLNAIPNRAGLASPVQRQASGATTTEVHNHYDFTGAVVGDDAEAWIAQAAATRIVPAMSTAFDRQRRAIGQQAHKQPRVVRA
jgi:TP901 family phage tail tape measure protein